MLRRFIHTITTVTSDDSLSLQLYHCGWQGQLPLNFSSFSKFWALCRNNSPLSGFSFISDVICWGKRNCVTLNKCLGRIFISFHLHDMMNWHKGVWVMQQWTRGVLILHLGYRAHTSTGIRVTHTFNRGYKSPFNQGINIQSYQKIKSNYVHWMAFSFKSTSILELLNRELRKCYCTSTSWMYWSSVGNMPIWPLGNATTGSER